MILRFTIHLKLIGQSNILIYNVDCLRKLNGKNKEGNKIAITRFNMLRPQQQPYPGKG